jgi:hypothetical protein
VNLTLSPESKRGSIDAPAVSPQLELILDNWTFCDEESSSRECNLLGFGSDFSVGTIAGVKHGRLVARFPASLSRRDYKIKQRHGKLRGDRG